MEQALQFFIQPLRCLLTHTEHVIAANQKTRLRKSRLRISMRGPAIWNNFVANTEKELESSSLFKSKIKTKLLDFESELTFF